MILNKVKISGIFNLKDVEISLDDLSALIAPNNYGKSNVLHAIDFGVFFMEASSKGKSNGTITAPKRLENKV